MAANNLTTPVNLQEKLSLFSDLWSPKVIAEINDYQLKVAKVKGDFDWHKHNDIDEAFIVLKGRLTIYFRDKHVTLKEGELFVVPKGCEHKPSASVECHILLIEPTGIRNTGNKETELTAPDNIWI